MQAQAAKKTPAPKWEQRTFNQVLYGNGFFISYNPDTTAMGVDSWTGDGDTPDETALVNGAGYKILNGDFRAAYEKLVPQGYDACLKFYNQQAAHADSKWSGQ